MKGVKGKLLKTIKSIKPRTHLKQNRILRPFSWTENSCLKDHEEEESAAEREQDVRNVSELIRDLPHESMDPRGREDNIENNGLQTLKQRFQLTTISEIDEEGEPPVLEIDISSFRRPEINSSSLFDPKLLAAFQQAVTDCIRMNEEEREWAMQEENLKKKEEQPPLKSPMIELEKENPLLVFPEKCPPGGSSSVILYATSLRGIRKTFEDCNSIRIILQSFKVLYFERDVSIHRKFREELWQTLGGKFLPPKLFINGRFIGGAEEVLNLHEQDKLKPLLQGLPMDVSDGCPCGECGGIRFVLCFSCRGSHRLSSIDGKTSQECPDCNENGLILCPCCCH